MELVPELAAVSGALFKATGNGSVPQTTISLIQLRAGQIVGNTYLTIFNSDNLRRAGEKSEEKITAVATWWDAPYFTDAERAALALVEAVLQPATQAERVSDELFAYVSEHYDAQALTTLVIAIGQVNFFAALATVGKPLAGKPAAEQWT
jgi:alkylhydroperoxidase family enzyme